MKPKVLLGTRLTDLAMKELSAHFEVVDLNGRKIDDLLTSADEFDGLLSVVPSAEFLARAGKLRALSLNFAGYDAVDVGALNAHGVLLMNSPNALTETTADLAFTLILATARRTVEMADLVRDGRWTHWLGPEVYGIDVWGQTLGIVGMGRIGSAIARRAALGFGMKILYHARSPKPEIEAELGAVRRELHSLLTDSDFVCLVVPLSPETERLIGARELALMKPTSILVNIARGRVVDEAALIEALQRKQIHGAGLDVFDPEPVSADSPLLKMTNVVVSPHIGSATQRTRDGMLLEAVQNLVSYLIHGKPQNAVNLEAVRT